MGTGTLLGVCSQSARVGALRWVGKWLIAILLLCGPDLAIANEHLLSKGYWYDAGNAATIEQARGADYTPFTGVLSKGYLPGTSWVRLKIRGVDVLPEGGMLMLWIEPTYLNEVTLFDPLQQWKPLKTGDAVQEPSVLIRPDNLGFKLPVSTTDRDVYLRIRSTSTHLLSVEVMPLDEFLIADGFQTFWHGLFFGGLTLIALWAVFEWFGKRDKLVAQFLIKHLAVMFYSVGYLGYLAYIFKPNSGAFSPDTIFSYSMFVLLVVALRFHVSVLREYGLAGWRIRAVEAFYLFPLAEFVLAVSGHMQAALKLNAMAVMLMPVAVFVLLLSSRQSAEVTPHKSVPTYLSKRTLLIYYGFIVTLLVAGATQVIGLVKGGQLVLHAFLFHSFISSILLMTMLQLRARQIQQRHLAVSREAARAQGELAAERLAREEQGRMVEMLSHEIKTPLSVLQLAIEEWIQEKGELRVADRSIQEIKSVVDRAIAATATASGHEIPELFDLGALVEWQVELTGIIDRFAINVDGELQIASNRSMVEQMVGNLIDNALKYGAKTSPITIRVQPSIRTQLEQEQSGVSISIANEVGCAGQPDRNMIFKKYYRAEAAKSRAGTGVGLYLVQQFARFLGGAIQYRPTQTSVEFVLWLPNSTSSL